MTVHHPITPSPQSAGLLVRTGVAATGALLATGVFGVVANQVIDQQTTFVDNGVLAETVEHRTGPLTGYFEAVTTAAEIPLAILAAVLAVLLAWRSRTWAPLVLTALSGVGAVALATAVKNLTGRARPASWWQLVSETGFSFPSRHTTVATALLLITAYLLARRTRTLLAALVWWPAALALATLIAASRVYLGVHWATDVTAATALGAAWAFTVITAHLLLHHRSTAVRQKREEPHSH